MIERRLKQKAQSPILFPSVCSVASVQPNSESVSICEIRVFRCRLPSPVISNLFLRYRRSLLFIRCKARVISG